VVNPIANHAPMEFLGPVRPGWTACALQLLARTDDALGLSYLVRREVPWIKDRLVDMENPAFVGQSNIGNYGMTIYYYILLL